MPKRKSRDYVTDTPERDNPVLEFVSPRLSDDEWDAVQGRLWDLLRYNVIAKAQLDQSLGVWNDLYENRVPQTKEWPWPDAANLFVPMTSSIVDGLHARLSKAALGVRPLILVHPLDSASSELAKKIERYYDDFVQKTQINEAISDVIFLAIRDGVGLMKVNWEERKKKIKARTFEPILDEDQQPVIDPVENKPATKEEVKTIDYTVFDNVRGYPVELKDFYLIPSHAYTLERFGPSGISGAAKGCAHRLWIRMEELQRLAEAGVYKKEAVDMLKDNAALERDSAAIQTDVTMQGLITVVQPYQKDKEYEIFEIYLQWDLNNDGFEEECVFAMAFKWGIMLRAEIFDYWHQMAPFIDIVPWRRPRRFYGRSVPGMLEGLQRELNTIRNQRVDAVTIGLTPPLKVVKSAITRADLSQAWGPGSRLEVETPDDVSPLAMPPINPEIYTEENNIRQDAERIVGLFDVNTPRGTGSRRTRSEIGSVQQETYIRFDYMMKELQKSIVRLFEMIHALKLQYMPDQESFARKLDPQTGEMTEETITRQEMAQANIEFRCNGDLPVADQQQEREAAYFLYSMFIQNPLVMGNLQRVHALSSKVLKAWNERSDEAIIGSTEEAAAQQQQMMQQQQQAAAMGGQPGGPQGQQGQPPGAGGQPRMGGAGGPAPGVG